MMERAVKHDNGELSNLPPEAFDPFDTDRDMPFDPQDHWLRTAEKDDQLIAMREWFYARYCDPAQETPYDGREGGYLFIHGGPFNPADVLPERFSGIVDDDLIQELIEELHSDVGHAWAPVQHLQDEEVSDEHFTSDEKTDRPFPASKFATKTEEPSAADDVPIAKSADLEWEDKNFWNGEATPAAQTVDSANVQEATTRLDLAQAYIAMGDTKGAREILLEVIAEGASAQRAKAQALMEALGPLKESGIRGKRAQKDRKLEKTDDTSPPTSAFSKLSATTAEAEAESDFLGREKLTQALHYLLTDREDTHPFAIGLFGHWGTGKSSQINFLQAELTKAETPKIVVTEFNAWQNEKATNLAAMLAQAVVDGLVADKGFFARLCLAVQLAVARHSQTRKAIEDDLHWPAWLWVLLPPLGAFFALVALLWYLPISDGLVAAFFKFVAGAGAAFAGIYHFMRSHLTEWFKRLDMQKSLSLLSLPDYSAHRGLILEIHHTLKNLCELCLKGNSPKEGTYLLLVVDDLDRCGVDTVKEVLDVIRLVTHINRVVTLVAIDERMAFAAVERHYHLFGHAGRAPALVARDYLAKVLQVSLTLPELDSDTVGSYVDRHIFGDNGSQDAPQIHADKESEEQPVQAALRNNRTEAALLPESQPDEKEVATAEILPSTEPSAREVQKELKAHPESPLQTSLPKERELFKELAIAYGFSNPRLLWRLYLGWKLLKSLTLSTIYTDKEVIIPIHLLFWREWLRTQTSGQRDTYSHWIESNDRAKPDGMPEKVHKIANSTLRKKWNNFKVLVGPVDAVLLPESPGDGTLSEAPQKHE